KIDDIDENIFSQSLSTKQTPNPDLIIRTGGEVRLSNFLLWESAYAELFFTKKLWPDFDKNDLMQAIESFKKRERRYGGSGG
ncbi:MAG: undecaprenyl diphosphate synthase family protein, partial [Pseudomonadota bacterium]|nr:undecaprenyl diphosphate synthase family protein [Pseudomonadota bacterium]